MKLKRQSLSAMREVALTAIESVSDEVIGSSQHDGLHLSTLAEVPRKRKRKTTSQNIEVLATDGSDEKRKIKKAGDSSVKKNNENTSVHSVVPGNIGFDELCNDMTVYIEGLPYDSTEEEVKLFFESCGRVQSVRLPKWHDSGRLRGYGHVQFLSSESVTKALDLDGCDMKGRYIKVDKPQTPRALLGAKKVTENVLRPPGCRSVFVKNIPYDTTEEDITEVFKVCGPITCVRLAVWGNTKQLKGFGYIDFKREDSAEIAVKKSGTLSLKGRPVVIDFETGAPKKSFRKPDGKVWSSIESRRHQKSTK